ncbi:hypothetical protein NMY22_g8633 [Coprinellus aureogranulatus]|nr:hypothetical protein NMY22_g8633 [Coprinellus aureogranulatus]
MTCISDLALEILQEIISLIPHTCPTQDPPPTSFSSTEVGYPLKESSDRYRKLAPLRTTCHAFDDAIQPVLFSEVVIDCLHTRIGIIRSQFASLASGRGPWKRYTKSLKIVNLDPCYDRRPSGGGVQYWVDYLSPEQRDAVYEMQELVSTSFLPSIRNAFPELEALSWFVRVGGPVQDLVDHFSRVTTLKSLTLVFWNDSVIQDFPLNSFSSFSEVSLFFFHEGDSTPIDETWYSNVRQLTGRLQQIIESSPDLASLRLARKHRQRRGPQAMDRSLFPSDFLLTPSARQLRELSLRRFDLVDIDEDDLPNLQYYNHLAQNLVSLTTLDLTQCGYCTCPAIWNALAHSNVLLSHIKVDYITLGLIAYLHRPEVPLESLTLLLHNFSLYDDLDWGQAGDIARQTYTSILDRHQSTLKMLDYSVMAQELWWLEVERLHEPADSRRRKPRVCMDDTSLWQCKELRTLRVTLDMRDATSGDGLKLDVEAAKRKVHKLIKTAASLPKLEELTIYYPESRGYSYAYFPERPQVHTAIKEMVIPESESKNFGFDVVFQEASQDAQPREWRFVDINAEEDAVEEEQEADEEEDEETRAEANVRGIMELVHFDEDDD